MKIIDIDLGSVDGEEESRDFDFLGNYFERKTIIDGALNASTYVIKGRQGSGKTLLSHYIIRKYGTESNIFERVSFGSITVSSLAPSGMKLIEDDYYHIFEWTFLVELAKLLLSDDSLTKIQGHDQLKAMLVYITKNFSLHKKTINKILTSGIEFNLPFGGIKLNKEVNRDNLSIITEEIKDSIIPLLSEAAKNGTSYILFIDDIDDHLRLTQRGNSVLVGMIKSVYRLNFFIRDHNPKSKIALMLRSDMFDRINYSQFNKIRVAHTIDIDWPRQDVWRYSELGQMIALKINRALPTKQMDSAENILEKYFPTYIKSGRWEVHFGSYFLSRTFYRPRDVVQFLKIIQNRYSANKSFTHRCFHACEREYSAWFKTEIETELSTHYDDEFIKNCFSIISYMNKSAFDYKELTDLFRENNIVIQNFNIKNGLKILYNFGVLFQSYRSNDDKSRSNYLHSYKGEGIDMADDINFFNNKFHLHFGLRKAILRSNSSDQRNSRRR